MDNIELMKSFLIWIVTIPFSALLLMASTRIFKLKEKSYKTAIKVIVIIGFLGFAFTLLFQKFFVDWFMYLESVKFIVLYILVTLLLIKKFYAISIKKTFAVWVVWLIFHFIFLFLVIGPLWAVVSFSMMMQG